MATKKPAPLGLVLRGLRAWIGITQQAHADAAGIGPGYLSKLETGQRKASYERVLELIRALGIGRQAETQARLAILHGDGILSAPELSCLVAHHACRPVICLFTSHATFGDQLERCGECGERLTCLPEGHKCPNGCETARPWSLLGGPSDHRCPDVCQPSEAAP